MGNPACGEIDATEGGHLHRMIDQIIIVPGTIATEAPWFGTVTAQAGGNLPVAAGLVFGWLQIDGMGLFFLAVNLQEHAGAVEVGMIPIEMGAAHRKIIGIDLVFNEQRSRRRLALPGALVQLVHGDRMAFGRGDQANHVFCEVPNHVTAGDPGGQ